MEFREKMAKREKGSGLLGKAKSFRRRGKEGVEEQQSSGSSPFAAGSRGGSGSGDGTFYDSFEIKDNIGPLPSEKEQKKNRKGKSPIGLGAKYGGQRRFFAGIALLLIAALVFSILSFLISMGKMGKGEADEHIKDAVAAESASKFPAGDAGMWVESFTRVYGTWDYKTPDAREADLSPYLAPGMDPQAGWDGEGTQKVIYSAVSSQPEIIDDERAIFDTMYQVQDGTWRCTEVPVFAYKPDDSSQGPVDQWGFAVTANPTPVPCALRVSVPQLEANDFEKTDQAAAETLRSSFFPGFFSAWVSSDPDTLRQYMAPDVKTFGLGGIYAANPEINNVVLPIGAEEDKASPNNVYTAYVSLTVTDRNGSALDVTYKVPVASNGSQWQVMGEPEALVQELEGVGTSDLSQSTGKDVSEEGQEEMNEYAEPEAAQGNDGSSQEASLPEGE